MSSIYSVINANCSLQGSGSPYHTVHGSDTLHGVVVNPLSDSFFRQHRSNSWSDSLDDSKAIQAIHESVVLNGNGNMTMSQSNGNGGSQSLTNGYSQRPGSGNSGNRNSILDPSLGRKFLFRCSNLVVVLASKFPLFSCRHLRLL